MTVTVVEQDAVLVAMSVTVTWTTFEPNGNAPRKESRAAAGGSLAGTPFVCTGTPFSVHKTVIASPSASGVRGDTSHTTRNMTARANGSSYFACAINPRIAANPARRWESRLEESGVTRR